MRRRRRVKRAPRREQQYVPSPDPVLDAARQSYMNTDEWWMRVWADDTERR